MTFCAVQETGSMDRKDKPAASSPPANPMKAMAAVFGKAAEQEAGAERAYLQNVARKAAEKGCG